ncbi:hypothetical protein [Tessaracoccus sp. OH4464_COT-324]|uniref:hypothetical protein n=1 Tax=Tessaracoccus sp. OH4464_COT-324 TaxID=2491059 RepID=UPI000F62DA4A|nr:hypothetical protein [Tessaracoccus sp. OH4464_COT-324]RRD45611.1 hypothetical protein EII42_10955 [Tessaracoccus sp. OH4464_COT-324]
MMTAASDIFEDASDEVMEPPDFGGAETSASPADQGLVGLIKRAHTGWYPVLGSIPIKLGSDNSKMSATADNCSNTEDSHEYVAGRYWQ